MSTIIIKKGQVWMMAVAIVLIVGGVVAIALIVSNGRQSDNSASSLEQKQPVQVLDYVTYVGQKDKAALNQLKDVATNVATENSAYGEYVDGIGTQKGGTDGKYWSFYVDGKLSQIGAEAYIAKGGEKIEWKFEKLQ